MTEAEILELLFSIFDRYWTIVQWWASVSFGLIMIAHFAAERLHAFIVVIVVGLYTVYSAWVYLLLVYNVDIAFGLLQDLYTLDQAGALESHGARVALEDNFVMYGTRLGMIALPATFVACIGYLIHAYAKARRR